jgi:putative endonuclease
VYLEKYQYVQTAIRREKQIKGWDRAKRLALIERENPTWEDLAAEWGEPIEPLKPVVAEGKADPSVATATS